MTKDKKPETALERLERVKREKEATKSHDLVSQLTHESTGETNLEEIARKLKARQAAEKKSAMTGAVKYTIYVDEDVATAFQALCLERGDQRRYVNQALREFVEKKAKELGL